MTKQDLESTSKKDKELGENLTGFSAFGAQRHQLSGHSEEPSEVGKQRPFLEAQLRLQKNESASRNAELSKKAERLKALENELANARVQLKSYSSHLNQQSEKTSETCARIFELEAQLKCYAEELKKLRAGSATRQARAQSSGNPSLIAFPHHVPVVRGLGWTEVTWDTGDGSHGEVHVSRDGEPELIFGIGGNGSQGASWILPRTTYKFRLYSLAPQKRLLDEVIVIGVGMPRPESRDVLFGFLDSPVEDSNGRYLDVSGWAYSTEGSISWVEAFLDDVPLGLLKYGEPRSDVPTDSVSAASSQCGFSGRLLLDDGLVHRSNLRVRVTDELGNIRDLCETEPNVDPAYDYPQWVKLYDTLSDADVQAILACLHGLKYKPLISIVMPVFNVEEIWLRKAIESVQQQLYPHWELCIADDNSTDPHVRKVLDEYAGRDERIRVVYRTTNGHISAASNSALELATGEFVALMDNDDELPKHALYMVVTTLNDHPETDLIYTDEDKIDEKGRRREPHFKSDWNPDLFYSCNMISHLGVYRSKIIKKIGGFRESYEGSQDYDLALRFIEQIPEDHIRHIPRVLYHWRAIAGSVALASGEKDYAHEAARRAIRSHLKRNGVEATVTQGHCLFHRVIYPVPNPAPLVSLIVPTRDCLELLSQTVDGLLNETDYDPLEIIIVDNQSRNPATLNYLHEIQKDERVKVIEYDAPFNYSAINNLGVRESSGELIGLINNDIKVISPGWLKEMVSHAVRPGIGAVGAKLLYPDDTVQHAGVILGVNGVAAHVHRLIPKDSPGYIARALLIQSLSAVTGACIVLPREVFLEIGGLDEVNLTVAFNDVDLCIRIREQGYRIVWTPYAELYHLESASRGSDFTPETKPRFFREVEYMMQTWDHVLKNDPYYNPNLTMVNEDFSLAVPPRVTRKW